MRRMTILAIALLLLCGWPFGASAEPADTCIRRNIRLLDGGSVTALLSGDENAHYWLEPETQKCFVRAKGHRDQFVSVDKETIRRNVRREVTMAAGRERQAREHLPSAAYNYFGKKRGIVLLVEFADKSFKPEHNMDFYYQMLNQLNDAGRGIGLKGCVRDYFLEQSNGRFDVTFDIYGPVRLSKGYAYYGEDGEERIDTRYGELVKEVCEQADKLIDFSRYDWGYGVAAPVNVIYAGLGQSVGGDDDTFWSKATSFSAAFGGQVVRDGIQLGDVAFSYETRMIGAVESSGGIGTFCHEFSHCLGLPDTYSNDDTAYGTTQWDLMGTGVHNDNGRIPAGFTAFDKMLVGWQTPIELVNDTVVNRMLPLSEGGQSYVMVNRNCPSEFFLLENRQKRGFDASLPGEGLMIMHVDYHPYYFTRGYINNLKGSSNAYERCRWVVADNSTDAVNRNTDAYPCEANNSFTNQSVPASWLHHPNIDGQRWLSKPVTNITLHDDGTISFAFRNQANDQGFIPQMREITVTSPGTLSSTLTDEDCEYAKSLKISGDINGTDLKELRRLCGRDEESQPTSGQIVSLDLSDARFLAGGDAYRTRDDGNLYITEPDVMPPHAFQSTNLTSIVLPKSCKGLTDYALASTPLSEVTFSGSEKWIGYAAFAFVRSLQSIHLPASIDSISNYAFYECDNLKTATMDANNPKFSMAENQLLSKDGKRLVQCVLTTLDTHTIPASVEELGSYAFSKAKMSHITLPSTLRKVGREALFFCDKLRQVTIEEGVEQIGSFAFNGCSALSSCRLPASLKQVGDALFVNCSGLQEVTVSPDSHDFSIEDNVLFSKDGTRLIQQLVDDKEEYVIPAHVTSIGRSPFRYISRLRSLTIPATVTDIGNYVFGNCTGLTDVYTPALQPLQLNQYVFANVDLSQTTLHVPAGRAAAYGKAQGWNSFGHIVEDLPNAIAPTTFTNPSASPLYDLRGIHVSHPRRSHIYISGGKKVVVR